jgi:hypothetical protein
VYVFRNNGDAWQYEDKIVSPEPQTGDNFGRALAIQGNLLVVTARKEKLTDKDVGAAYVFANKSGDWIFKTKITAGDPIPSAYFGQSVAIQGDVIAIGARNTDPNSAGGFYLFRQKGGQWIEVAKVTPPDGNAEDQTGFAIAIAGDTIIVTARRADPAGMINAGVAYVYTMKGDSVSLVTTLTQNDPDEGDEFGQSVAFAGSVLAVGAWKDDIDGNADQGSIYLFRKMGGRWVQTGKITASDGMAGDEFGYSMAALGNRMVTGAHFADSKAGAAYVLLLNS